MVRLQPVGSVGLPSLRISTATYDPIACDEVSAGSLFRKALQVHECRVFAHPQLQSPRASFSA